MLSEGTITRSIRLRNIALPVSIGIHDFEKTAPQRVIFNITLELSDSPGEESDDIADALDYDQVRETVLRVARARHYNLQENLCREIVEALKGSAGLARLTVASEKPDVYPDCDGVGYQIVYEPEVI
jgi:dihydroneopterin aldolase